MIIEETNFFKCRSIYFASYLLYKYDIELAGTKIEGPKVVFLFDLSKAVIDKALKEFMPGGNGSVIMPEYMKYINKLKDIARSLTKR